jgi:hypothetical protein
MRVTAAVATGLVLGCLLPVTAAGQQVVPPDERGMPGLLTARAFRAAPAEAAIAVTPYDDSGLNLRLKQDFEAALEAGQRGRVESRAEADYMLLFETEVVPAAALTRAPSLGSARVDEGGAEVNVNVWSSSQDSVLGGRQERPELGSSAFHINAVLREAGSGAVVWQGDAYYRLTGPDTERVARAMVGPLIEKMGQTVVRESFTLE